MAKFLDDTGLGHLWGKITAALSDKMDKENPMGTGSFSLNRQSNTTIGNYSFAEGRLTTASGNDSHAEGSYTSASNDGSHAEGYSTLASGAQSHAEGYGTLATGWISHAEGRETVAAGRSSHAEGQYTIAIGESCHVGGEYNIRDVNYPEYDSTSTYVRGDNVIYENIHYSCFVDIQTPEPWTSSHWARVVGRETYVEVIGNGTSDNDRSNARTLDWHGNETIAGDLIFGSNPTSLTSALNHKADASDLSTVAFSGSYSDLSNTPALPGDYKHSTYSQTINNTTLTQITSVTLSKGYWLVFGSVSFASNTTGRRAASLYFSDQSTTINEFLVTQLPISGAATHMQVHALYYASGNITAYVQGWHNAGTNLTGCEARIAAIRIS